MNMSVHKLAAVVILYNPQNSIVEIIKNIESYAKYLSLIYLIDNSSNDNSSLFKNASFKFKYFLNKNKGGIGGAQNIGCSEALKNGYEWAMTMDQDSIFDDNEINNYLNKFENLKNNNSIKSFGTEIINLNESNHWTKKIKKTIKKLLKKDENIENLTNNSEFIDKETTIASGNIINLKAWKKINGFDEILFIDEVDSDFCHRLKNAGFRIIVFKNIFLNQHFGNKLSFSLFPKYKPVYNDFRYYYVFRNKFISLHDYPQFAKSMKRHIFEYFVDYCINTLHPLRHFKIFLKARRDAVDVIKNRNL